MSLLLLLARNWKLVLFGAVLAALSAYIGILYLEVNHYKSKVYDLQTKIDEAEIRRQRAESLAKQRADEITKIHKESLKRENALIEENNKLVKDKINANKELKRIKLSLNLVQLWNSSKQPIPAAPEAKQGNDGEASGTETTLDKLFLVSAENDKNHLKCVKQVLDWQNFWLEYVKAKEEADAKSSGRAN